MHGQLSCPPSFCGKIRRPPMSFPRQQQTTAMPPVARAFTPTKRELLGAMVSRAQDPLTLGRTSLRLTPQTRTAHSANEHGLAAKTTSMRAMVKTACRSEWQPFWSNFSKGPSQPPKSANWSFDHGTCGCLENGLGPPKC